ncbi:unnamed protein product [Owenia fusiformis]|uniref:GPI inositol-deacylase n=1 Tax=Owenia fusiformis TaxID=6347 RepID=A0A8J1XYK3_OWEFU|nr:unnamed protein product [Owenia fusiformis]
MAAPMKTIFVISLFAVILLGAIDVLLNFEKNGCEMTYMYEYPHYEPVPLKKSVEQKYPKYGLYVYGEGAYARTLGKMEFNGIPVLFIPGNAGSYKQVRSLGSVAYRRMRDKKIPFQFNYFSIDFSEELSGVYGGVLQEQTEFVHVCLKHILTLYKKASHPPSSVVIVGHSMGGIIARGLFALTDFNSKLINTIITQATPHQAPVMAMDIHVKQYYDKVNAYWHWHVNDTLKDVTIVSTGGGYRDNMVRSGLTSLRDIVPPERSLSTLSMSVPKAWVSTDHLCAVWCKQMVMATKRAMFDIIDRKTHQVITNTAEKMAIFRHHLYRNKGGAYVANKAETPIVLDKSIKQEVRTETSWRFLRNKVKNAHYFCVMIPQGDDWRIVATSTVDVDMWVLGCKADQSETCLTATDLSHKGGIIPPQYANKKMISIKPTDVTGFTHVILSIPKSKTQIEVTVETFTNTERYLSYTLLNISRGLFNFPNSLMTAETVIKATRENELFYDVELIGLSAPLQAYTASLTSLSCSNDTQKGNYDGSLMILNIPWSNENVYQFSKPNKNSSLAVKLQIPRPQNFEANARLQLFLQPGCTYRLAMKPAWTELLGQLVRFYGNLFPTFIVINILMVLSWQLHTLHKTGSAVGFTDAHTAWGQSYRVAPPAALLRIILGTFIFAPALQLLRVPRDDVEGLAAQGIWFPLLPLSLYVLATSLVLVHHALVSIALYIASAILGFICARCCRSNRSGDIATFFQYNIVVIATLVAGIFSGSVGLVMVFVLLLAKVLLLHIQKKSGTKDVSTYNVYKTVLLLWNWLVILNAPSLIVWFQNLSYSMSLSRDPARVTSIVSCLSLIILFYTLGPVTNRAVYKTASWAVYLQCIPMVLYSISSIYRISYFITIAILFVAVSAILQLVVPSSEEVDISEPTVDGKEKTE